MGIPNWPTSRRKWARFIVLATMAIGIAIPVWWTAGYAVAVHGLPQGVGDMMFYGADGQPGFRLDGQHLYRRAARDLTLAEAGARAATRILSR